MIKVIMNANGERLFDLLPENMTVQEAVEQFHMDSAEVCIRISGKCLSEEELASALLTFSRESEVRITALPLSRKKTEVQPAKQLQEQPSADAEKKAEAIKALLEAKKAIDLAIKALDVSGEDELPF